MEKHPLQLTTYVYTYIHTTILILTYLSMIHDILLCCMYPYTLLLNNIEYSTYMGTERGLFSLYNFYYDTCQTTHDIYIRCMWEGNWYMLTVCSMDMAPQRKIS